MIHYISAEHLSIERLQEIIDNNYKIALSEDSRSRIIRCREYLDNKMENQKEPIYGVTTGFGSLCNVSVGKEDLAQLQYNLVMSHACGTGDRVPSEIVKLMLILKIQSLSYGHSGAQLPTIERMIEFFNNDILPVVYEQGSLGASGDLAPLAHLSLPLINLGEVEYKGEVRLAAEVNAEFGWSPIELRSKEGLALLNGTQFMSAYGVWSLMKSKQLCLWADTVGSISLDAYDGRIEPFSANIQAVRAHNGQKVTAENFRKLLSGSEILKREGKAVQDPYSFRCIPQVHGATKDTVAYVESVITTEINSTTDNPTIFPETDEVISAGNFHGQPIALAMDFLAIAMAELANIAERRIFQLVSGAKGLPNFLVAKPGLNSGFMIPQYTAASIVSQSKGLCMPASVDSITSSQGQEDHVSMGSNSATKLRRVVLNSERVIAIELFNATQALEFRRPLRSSDMLEAIVAEYRKVVPYIVNDEYLHPHIESSIQFIRTHETPLN